MAPPGKERFDAVSGKSPPVTPRNEGIRSERAGNSDKTAFMTPHHEKSAGGPRAQPVLATLSRLSVINSGIAALPPSDELSLSTHSASSRLSAPSLLPRPRICLLCDSPRTGQTRLRINDKTCMDPEAIHLGFYRQLQLRPLVATGVEEGEEAEVAEARLIAGGMGSA